MRWESLEQRNLFAGDFGSVLSVGSDTNPVSTQAVAADESGARYTTGFFRGTIDFDPLLDRADGSDVLTSSNGTNDAFVAKYAADDTLLWARRMGGSQVEDSANTPIEKGQAIDVDANGNVLVTGNFYGTASFGAIQLTSTGSSDAFLTKLDGAGNFLWAQRWGTAVADQAFDVAVDSAGNATIVGSPRDVRDTGFYWNGMVMRKYGAAGNLTWGYQIDDFGGTATKVAADATGNVIVSGSFNGTVDFNPDPKRTASVAGAAGVSGGEGLNAYILSLSPSGAYQRVTPIIDTASSAFSIGDLDCDATGNIYVGGTYKGSVDFDPGRGTANYLPAATANSGYVAKLSSAGQWMWATSLGENLSAHNLAVDASGVYVAGATTPAPSNGNNALYLAKLTAGGSIQWTEYFGGTGSYLWGMTTNSGNIYVAGTFSGTADFDPDPNSVYELTNPAWADTFLLTLRK